MGIRANGRHPVPVRRRLVAGVGAAALAAAGSAGPVGAAADDPAGPVAYAPIPREAVGPPGIETAQMPSGVLPPSVAGEIARAAAESDGALLHAIESLSVRTPGLEGAIVREARRLRPDLAAEIRGAAAAGARAGRAGMPSRAAQQAATSAAAGTTGGGTSAIAWAGTVGLLAAAGGGVAVAVGGGSGGGDGGGSDGGAAAFETSEYFASDALGPIEASAAYARGADGSGITVAVLDSGLDLTHPEFTGQVASGGFDFVDSTAAVTDPHGHGTFVSGLLAARRDGSGIHGAAYDASILPVRILDATNAVPAGFTDGDLAAAVDLAVAGGADVLNNSWGTSTPVTAVTAGGFAGASPLELQAWRDAVTADRVVVFAAGNDGASEVSVRAGLPALFPELEDLWLAAVALDTPTTLASFSNACGVAADWCVAAPGTALVSTATGSGFTTGSGTSYAAPLVSGAIAVLLDRFPTLTPEQVVEILKVTAVDIGAPGVDAVFGHGRIDLEAASRPVGGLSVSTGSGSGAGGGGGAGGGAGGGGTAVALEGSAIGGGGAMGDALATALAGQTLVAVDAYDRGFVVDMESFALAAADRFDAADALAGFGRARVDTVTLGDAITFEAAMAPAGTAAADDLDGLESLRMTVDHGTAVTAAGYGDPGLGAFGIAVLRGDGADGGSAAPVPAEEELVVSAALAHPYAGLIEDDAVSAAIGWDAADSVRVTLASYFGGVVLDTEGAGPTERSGDAFGASVTVAPALGDRVRLGVTGGVLTETDTVLGSTSDGAFALGGGDTVFGGLTAAVDLGRGFAAHAGYWTGWTRTRGVGDSLVETLDGVRSDGFSLALVGRDGLVGGDRFGVAVSQPLRIADGRAVFDVPATDGSRQSLSADLEPSGRALDVQAWYARPLGGSATIGVGAAWRQDPGHVADADDDFVGLARLNLSF